jgi:hypothetical protein
LPLPPPNCKCGSGDSDDDANDADVDDNDDEDDEDDEGVSKGAAKTDKLGDQSKNDGRGNVDTSGGRFSLVAFKSG